MAKTYKKYRLKLRGGNILVQKDHNYQKQKSFFDSGRSDLRRSDLNSKISAKYQRGLIVGLDPGLTVGLAILDLSGNILCVNSFKEISRAEIIKNIIHYGRAVLIATDVHHHPKMVKKIASSFNSKIHSPYRDLAVSTKTELVEDYIRHQRVPAGSKDNFSDFIAENAHERDALAAAVQAFKSYQKKLELIKRRVVGLNLTSADVDEIKVMVINGVPITKAINAYLDEKKSLKDSYEHFTSSGFDEVDKKSSFRGDEAFPVNSKDDSEIDIELVKLRQKIKSQANQIRNLQNKNRILDSEVLKYIDEVNKLEKKIERLQYDYSQKILQKKEIATKNAIIKGLQDKYRIEKELREELESNLRSIKRIRAMELSKEALPVKIIDSFSKDAIREATKSWSIKKGDVVLLRSSEGGGSQTAALLIELGVKVVITTDKMSHQAKDEFKENMIPILEEKDVDLKMADDFAVIRTHDLDAKIKKWKKDQEEMKDEENRSKLLKIMDDYRAQRKRSMNKY